MSASAIAPAVYLLDADGRVMATNERGGSLLTSGGRVGESRWSRALGSVSKPERLDALLRDARSARGLSVEETASISEHGEVIIRCASPVDGAVVAVVVEADEASAFPSDHDMYPAARGGPYPVFLLDRASLLPFFTNTRGQDLLRSDIEVPRERALAALVTPESRRELVAAACLVDEATVWSGPYDAADGSGPLEMGFIAAEHGGISALIAVVVPSHHAA